MRPLESIINDGYILTEIIAGTTTKIKGYL